MSLGTSSGGWARRTLFRFVCHSITQHGEATSNRSSAFSLRERWKKISRASFRWNKWMPFLCLLFRQQRDKSWENFFCALLVYVIWSHHHHHHRFEDCTHESWEKRFYVPFCSRFSRISGNFAHDTREPHETLNVNALEVLHSALETRFLPFEPFSFFPFADVDDEEKKQKLIFHPFNSAQKLPKQHWMLIPATQRRPPCST